MIQWKQELKRGAAYLKKTWPKVRSQLIGLEKFLFRFLSAAQKIYGQLIKKVDRRYVNIAIVGLIFLVVSLPLNRLIGKSLDSTLQAPHKTQAISFHTDQPPQKIALKPPQQQNPSKLGIIAKPENDKLKLQAEWDQNMKKILVQSKALDDLEKRDALDEIRKTPQEFKNRLKLINDRIRRYEKAKQANPSDEDAQRNLENLYMLRATLLALEEKIIKKPQ